MITSVKFSSGKHVRAMNTPLKVKLGYAGVYLFFLFLLQNIDCGYSLEPPRRGIPTIYVLSKNKKNINIFLVKFSILGTEKISIYCMGISFRNVFAPTAKATPSILYLKTVIMLIPQNHKASDECSLYVNHSKFLISQLRFKCGYHGLYTEIKINIVCFCDLSIILG